MDLRLMDTNLIVLVVVAILIIALLGGLYLRKRKTTTAGLRKKFGSEYDRAVLVHGSERKAEAKLEDRAKRVDSLNLRDLDIAEHERFSQRWEAVQTAFIDSPKGAVAAADDLVSSLMMARGYPMSDFDQRAADISVDHSRVVENYRSAHEIALRVGKDQASTEELRTAMIHYRSLFEELAQVPASVERKEVA
jgi:FtsZ-interacting cell division protein ZipA